MSDRTNQPAPDGGSGTPAPEYNQEVIAAMTDFRNARPWRGTIEERKAKFAAVNAALNAAFGTNTDLSFDVGEFEEQHGTLTARKVADRLTLVLIDKLSVVTFLFGFALLNVTPMNKAASMAWAVGLYKRMFPLSAARMTYLPNGCVVKPENLN